MSLSKCGKITSAPWWQQQELLQHLPVPPGGKDWKVLEHFCNPWQHFMIFFLKHSLPLTVQMNSSNSLLIYAENAI